MCVSLCSLAAEKGTLLQDFWWLDSGVLTFWCSPRWAALWRLPDARVHLESRDGDKHCFQPHHR